MAKKKQHISGTGLKSAALFTRGSGGVFEADTNTLKSSIEKYLAGAAETGKYSLAGLCIALGITRERLALWRSGWFCAQDAADAAVMPNEKLAECVEMGLLHIQQHWEESDKPSSLCLKQLEATGALGEGGQTAAKPPFDLGRLNKFAR